MKIPNFGWMSPKKNGITWESANCHDFLDFRRSGSAKALEFAWITMYFLGSAPGVADLELMMKNRENGFLWKSMKLTKFHGISWNIMIFMKIVVSRPSPRRDPRNSMNYCSILQVLGTRIGGISWIFIFFLKIHNFHDFLKKSKNLSFLGFLWKNQFPAHAKLQNT